MQLKEIIAKMIQRKEEEKEKKKRKLNIKQLFNYPNTFKKSIAK
jgi:hypothetical protein